MSLSAEVKAIALALLEEFGESATFTRTAEGSYNPQTGEAADGSTTSFTANVAPAAPRQSERVDSEVQTNATQLYMMHASSAPAIGDVVTYNSVNYRLLAIETARLSGSTVLYTLDLQQ
jgi:hypothetical protein